MSNCTTDSIKTNPNCELSYFNAYDAYLKQMNDYCLLSDHSISNSLCADFIDNNQFIKDTDIQKKLQMQRTNVCLSNIDTTLNSTCLKLNIIPTSTIPASTMVVNAVVASTASSTASPTELPNASSYNPINIFEENKVLFIIVIVLFCCIIFGGIFFYFKRWNKKNINLNKTI